MKELFKDIYFDPEFRNYDGCITRIIGLCIGLLVCGIIAMFTNSCTSHKHAEQQTESVRQFDCEIQSGCTISQQDIFSGAWSDIWNITIEETNYAPDSTEIGRKKTTIKGERNTEAQAHTETAIEEASATTIEATDSTSTHQQNDTDKTTGTPPVIISHQTQLYIILFLIALFITSYIFNRKS